MLCADGSCVVAIKCNCYRVIVHWAPSVRYAYNYDDGSDGGFDYDGGLGAQSSDDDGGLAASDDENFILTLCSTSGKIYSDVYMHHYY